MMKGVQMFYKQHDLINKNIAVMFSGGPDSVALVHTLMQHGCMNMYLVYINYINSEAAPNARDNLDFVVNFAATHALALEVITVDVERDFDLGKGPEGNCRMAKKKIVNELIDDSAIDYVALGHNKDDHLETVLMQLFRGAGAGTRGIPDMIHGKVIRPLLPFAKRDIEEWCDNSGYKYFVDSQNYNTDCTRQFMRHQLIPLLESHYGKGIHKRIANIGKKFEEFYEPR